VLAEEAVVAVKEASFDRGQFAAVAAVARQQHVTLLTGNDNFILESFRLGADGALLGFGAVLTGEQVAMIDAWGDGRVADAEAYAARLQPLADAVFAPPVDRYRVRLKECLAALGILAGAHVRPPGQALDEPERARLHAVLRHAVGAGVGR
jgi:dihydrodipicolinate synthase/N-acetylneuraminate lyase